MHSRLIITYSQLPTSILAPYPSFAINRDCESILPAHLHTSEPLGELPELGRLLVGMLVVLSPDVESPVLCDGDQVVGSCDCFEFYFT